MRRLRVAVIGTGFWGKNQARVLSGLDCTELTCVCDTNAEAAANVGQTFNVQHTTSLQNALDREDVEAVTICTPTTTHVEIAAKALDAGKHVLVEKPMTNTAAEARRLIQQAERRGLRIMPGHIERFNPAVSYLKKLVKNGQLGNVILFLSRRVGRWPERIGDVGVVRDTAIHDIDLARFVFEQDVESVYARTGSMKHKKEDYAEIMLQFPKWRTAFIDANWLTPRKTRILVVTGSEATAQLDYITQEMIIENSGMTSRQTIEKKEPLAIELTHFAQSITGDRPFDVTGVDGLRAVEICEAVLKSSATGKTLKLAYSQEELAPVGNPEVFDEIHGKQVRSFLNLMPLVNLRCPEMMVELV